MRLAEEARLEEEKRTQDEALEEFSRKEAARIMREASEMIEFYITEYTTQ